MNCIRDEYYEESVMLATGFGEELEASTARAFRVWLSCGGKDLQAFLAQRLSVSALLVTLFCSTFLNIVVV